MRIIRCATIRPAAGPAVRATLTRTPFNQRGPVPKLPPPDLDADLKPDNGDLVIPIYWQNGQDGYWIRLDNTAPDISTPTRDEMPKDKPPQKERH